VSFGGVPPSNPCRGNLWWNGYVLQVFDGAGWMPTGGSGDQTGTAAMPGQIGEVLFAPFSQTISTVGVPKQDFVSPMGVGPGDWDCEAGMSYDGAADGISFLTASYVPGLVPQLAGSTADRGPDAVMRCMSFQAQLLTAANVALQFKLSVYNAAGGIGTINFWARARRAR
jgi:hypothetical protein